MFTRRENGCLLLRGLEQMHTTLSSALRHSTHSSLRGRTVSESCTSMLVIQSKLGTISNALSMNAVITLVFGSHAGTVACNPAS